MNILPNLRTSFALLVSLAIAAAALASAACEKRGNNNQGNPLTPKITYRISIVSGNSQSGRLDTPMANPLRVYVSDDSMIKQSSVRVNFKVTEGYADFSAASAVTDSDGYCEVTLTPTYAPGTISVEAEVNGTNVSVTFTLTGTQS
ncbi:MAG: hypothetical protein FVQ81_12060 [Candidatus Glassbacteria bacterium]|nr:hypothetical protein [Candidatus Glassbacteria bacterium]